jgi:hypothetical protein
MIPMMINAVGDYIRTIPRRCERLSSFQCLRRSQVRIRESSEGLLIKSWRRGWCACQRLVNP